MSDRKVCVVVASRANYGRVKSVLRAIQQTPGLELQLVVGASALLRRFGSAIDLVQRDGFEAVRKVYMIVEGENPVTMAKSTALGLLELPSIFDDLDPDVVLTIADRFETIATAVAASYMNIPVGHVQGGEVSGSIDENVRHAITKLSHLHFPATDLSAERIRRMGEREDRIFKVGCPSIDLLTDLPDEAVTSTTPFGGVGSEIDLTKPFLLVLQHPVTTEYGQGLHQINETLKALSRLRIPTVMFWPNVDAGSEDVAKGIRMLREHDLDFVHLFRNLAVDVYNRLLRQTACIVGNSSSAVREGSYLGTPAVNIGTRQRGRERGRNLIDVGYDAGAIERAVRLQIEHGPYPRETLYGDGTAGEQIAGILASCELSIDKQLTY